MCALPHNETTIVVRREVYHQLLLTGFVFENAFSVSIT